MKQTVYPPTLCFLLSLIGVLATPFVVLAEPDVIHNSIFLIILIGLYAVLLSAAIKVTDKRMLWYTGSTGLLFSLLLVMGKQIYLYENLTFPILLKCLGASICYTPILSALLILLLDKLPVLASQLSCVQPRKKNAKYTFFLFWAIIFVLWIPTFLAFFPGIFGYDVHGQMPQLAQWTFNAQHPVIHTLFLGATIELTMKLSGNMILALAIHSLVQMLILSLCYAGVLYNLQALHTPKPLLWLGTLYYSVFPIHSIYSLITTKDVLYSGFISLIFTLMLRLMYTGQHKHMLLFGGVIVFAMLIRNTGFYVILITTVITIFLNIIRAQGDKQYCTKLQKHFVVCLVLFLFISNGLNTVLEVKKGNIGEMLSVPLQQMARTVHMHGDELREEDLTSLYEIAPQEQIEQYNPYIADYVKAFFEASTFKDHPVKYVKLWARWSIKYPTTYLESFLINTLPAWYPGVHSNEQGYISVSSRQIEGYEFEAANYLPRLRQHYADIGQHRVFKNFPLIALLFSPAFHVWIAVCVLLIVLYYKKYDYLICISLLFGVWLTVLASPLVNTRYIYPIMACFPAVLVIPLLVLQED